MAKSLIIVESPAKARTIKKYLGQDYAVKASVGHVKDLPERRLGIDIAHGFTPEYVVIKGKGKILRELRAAARQAERVFLAPDPDREGEAIAWHIASELPSEVRDRIYRILMHEITKKGITEALQHPGPIDEHKVAAQQARRLLDRLVGYKISPLLWKKVQRGLSAGRVQSVALRLICERERAIEAFQPQEYWTIDALLSADGTPFRARLHSVGGKKVHLATEADAQRLVEALRQARYVVASVKKSTRQRHPAPPFITSTLQQEAWRRLRFAAQRTMRVAQQLYEGLPVGEEGEVGLITYMRTDSTRVAAEAVQEAQAYIRHHFGDDYVPARPRAAKKGKAVQDAHEAIRPTAVTRTPEQVKPYLSAEQHALYTLIWQRFVASQMASAVLDHTTVDIAAGDCRLRATGSTVRFAGFTVLYEESAPEPEGDETPEENRLLPPLAAGQEVQLQALEPKQHFTQPPPRFTEASLVGELEKLGIGRPSTYAVILSTLRERHYVEERERRLVPTELGKTVNDLLVQHFPDIFDVQFTAQLEDTLDRIEEGQTDWQTTLKNFYEPFAADLQRAAEKMRDVRREVETTEEVCDQCGRPMVIRWGRFGRFLACSGFPACKQTRELAAAPAEEPAPPCEACGRPMTVKRGRYGEFLACTGYPDCKTTRPLTVAMACPEPGCSGHIVPRRTRRGRVFYGCTNYPACTFSTWQRPVPRPCPQCQAPYLLEKTNRGQHLTLVCATKGCTYRETAEAASIA